MRKIIFFQPHPDDIDIFCPQILLHLTKKSVVNYAIMIAALTRGEGGIKSNYKDFNDDQISKIRTRELYNALKTYDLDPSQVHFFGLINNQMKFNLESVKLVRDFLEKEKPDIIFAPEPKDTYYLHQDHVVTGKIIYYICHKKKINKVPILYFYTSINPNFIWPFDREDFQLNFKLSEIYRSQDWRFQHTFPIYRICGSLYGKKIMGKKYAEGYRRVFFGSDNSTKRKLNFFQRIFKFINVKLSLPISVALFIGNILYL